MNTSSELTSTQSGLSGNETTSTRDSAFKDLKSACDEVLSKLHGLDSAFKRETDPRLSSRDGYPLKSMMRNTEAQALTQGFLKETKSALDLIDCQLTAREKEHQTAAFSERTLASVDDSEGEGEEASQRIVVEQLTNGSNDHEAMAKKEETDGVMKIGTEEMTEAFVTVSKAISKARDSLDKLGGVLPADPGYDAAALRRARSDVLLILGSGGSRAWGC